MRQLVREQPLRLVPWASCVKPKMNLPGADLRVPRGVSARAPVDRELDLTQTTLAHPLARHKQGTQAMPLRTQIKAVDYPAGVLEFTRSGSPMRRNRLAALRLRLDLAAKLPPS